MGQCASSKCCPSLRGPGSPYDVVENDTPPRTPRLEPVQIALDRDSQYGVESAAQQECEKLRRRVRELEAHVQQLESPRHNNSRLALVIDAEGSLSTVRPSKQMEQCSGPTQRLFEKLLGSHVLRMWLRFKEIDTDNDGRIGDYDIREWLHRVTPAEASAVKLLLALDLAADEPVDAQRFEQLVCLKDGVVSLRSQLTGMAAGELEAPLAAVTNRFKRAVNEISGPSRENPTGQLLVEHMQQAAQHSNSSQGVHTLMLAINPDWAEGDTVDFAAWADLCSSLRGRAADSVKEALLVMWTEEHKMIEREFSELWRPNGEGMVDERRIREFGSLVEGDGAAKVNTREILQLMQCEGQRAVDMEAYLKFMSLLEYKHHAPTATAREENPSAEPVSAEGAAAEHLGPAPDPATLSCDELRAMFNLSEGLNPLATGDDTETTILRNVVAVVRARHTTNWVFQKEKGGISLSTRQEPNNRAKGDRSAGVRIETSVDLPARLLYEVMTDPHLNATGSSGTEYQVVCKLDPALKGLLRLAHSKIKIPLFADQDFALGEYMGQYHDCWVYAFNSVQDRRVPQPKGRCVRGVVQLGGWAFLPVGPSETRITFVSVVDPNRSVPKAMVSQGHDRSAKAMKTFIKNCHEHVKKHKIDIAEYYE